MTQWCKTWSITLTMSLSSSSEGDQPNVRITWFIFKHHTIINISGCQEFREATQLHMKPTYKAFLIIVTKFSFTMKSFVTCPSSSSPIEPPPSLNPIKTQCCCQQCYFCCFQHLWCHHQHHKHDAQEPPVKEGENLAILFQQVKRETLCKLFGKSTFLPEKFWEKNTFYSLSFRWSPYQDPRQTSSQNLRQSY